VGKSLLIIEASRSHSVTQITVGRTPLDEWSARRRDLYLTTHSSHKRQTSMPPAVLKPIIPASQRPQNHSLTSRPLGYAYLQLISCNLSADTTRKSLTACWWTVSDLGPCSAEICRVHFYAGTKDKHEHTF